MNSNQLPKIPAYWVVNLHSSYKVTDNLEVFALVRNLFDQHYYVYGTLFDVTSFPYLNLTDPRTFIPGVPLAAYVGLRGTMPDARPVLLAAAPSPAPPDTRPPMFDWTGVYVGLNAGYSFGSSNWSDSVTGVSTGAFGTSGFLFGGTLGANYQVGRLVLGVEGDGGFSKASGFATFTTTPLCAGGCITSNGWLATARGRIGYAFDRFLAYGTGGAVLGNVQANYSNDAVSNLTSVGWTVGAGVEAALTPQWSLKAEYLFVDLAGGGCSADCTMQNPNGPALIPNIAVKFNESIVRAGLNYKFADAH